MVWHMAKTVLIVDDDPTQRRLMQAAAEKQGFRARVEGFTANDVGGDAERQLLDYAKALVPAPVIEATGTSDIGLVAVGSSRGAPGADTHAGTVSTRRGARQCR